MNIFANISHPAHVHLFKNTIATLSGRGHKIIVGSRKKEFTSDMLDAYGIDHIVLTSKGRGPVGLARELITQQFKIARIVKNKSIDLMIQMNGIFNAPVGKLFGIPTLAFSDTENDIWANRLSFSLTKHVFVPTCFDHQAGGTWKNMIHYPGYHELAYLAPKYLSEITAPKALFLVRFVGWGAGHDIGETGLSNQKKIEIVNILKKYGDVRVSSESPLPGEIGEFAYRLHPAKMHEFMMKCKMVVGESATMASEAACLGIPAIFISNTGRGYTTEQDKRYGLIKHFRLSQWDEIIRTLKDWSSRDLFDQWQDKRQKMLRDKMDVTSWMTDLVENYPESIGQIRRNGFEKYALMSAK